MIWEVEVSGLDISTIVRVILGKWYNMKKIMIYSQTAIHCECNFDCWYV